MRNLEAKFKLFDFESARKRAEALGYQFKGTFRQHDTFFRVRTGKLKLREQAPDAWLIYYASEQNAGLKLSNYEVIPVADAAQMRSVLAAALGALAEVKKERTLLGRGNIRLHLDRVDGLGDFGEIEAVIAEGGDPASERRAVNQLLDALDVRRTSLIGASYFEMLRPVK